MIQFTEPYDDPFSEIQGKLETLLGVSVQLQDEAPPDSGITDGRPKTIMAPADFGEWAIQPAPGGGARKISSTSTQVVQNFEIGLMTDRRDAKEMVFPLKWRVMRLLLSELNQDPTLGLPYVSMITFLDVREQKVAIDSDYETGTPGWIGVIIIAVTMKFSDFDLLL